ncbi:MAG: hypothetical protein IH870_09345, partial [Chloroflexi bacterium]|nr:hypothetical protein [Chloroflexota bacterium]
MEAERAFFLVRRAPSGDEPAVAPLEVIAALDRDLTEIRDAAEQIDHHYLGEISVVDGIRLLTPEEDGSARILLTCSFAVESGVRGLFLLDAPSGTRRFGRESTRVVEDTVRETLHELRSLYTIDSL